MVLVAGVITLGESTLGIGLVLPGETVLIAAAMAVPDAPAAVLVIGVVAAAAAAGDMIGYTIGRRLGSRIRDGRLIRRMGQDRWDEAARTLRRHGSWAVLFARFLPVVRTMTPAAAGASELPLRRFLPAVAVGATAWATLHVTAGYLLREAAEKFEYAFGILGWTLLGVALLAGAVAWAPVAIPALSPRMSGLHLVRGAAIGVVETVPGVSGGTMALVVGIYERLIAQAGHLVGAVRALLPGGAGRGVRPREELRRLDWGLLVPVAAGMVLAVVLASQFLPGLIEAHPVGARAVFFGMVTASVAVPLRITGRIRGAKEWAIVVVAFAGTVVVSGLPPAAGEGRPPNLLVGLAAAIAVCALVLPGFSGSFLLLVLGLYEQTLRAVRDLDLAYLAAFAVGAVLGLGTFVSLLQWLLAHHRRTLMVVMVGVLPGALRALWPWQDAARGALAPDPGWYAMLVPALLGAALVAGIMVLERRLEPRTSVGGQEKISWTPSTDSGP
ncbi:undecaprenyl phosphate translocase family protein [Pseudonocardia parietis]|uniref:Membrane protein/membrane protein DedA with SNARE-associated domain n=1 Tax=Pseudonocardia parietis TaxID=570936 RepID=A0ABS4VUC7_9PSEU|nr:DUF368 domain-containing protein [Pseudonocardia parietis]MBP2367548.1 putative membrane protein/membrane protein DedA with SNARE-associated domain [Pseudonocardia parietis]